MVVTFNFVNYPGGVPPSGVVMPYFSGLGNGVSSISVMTVTSTGNATTCNPQSFTGTITEPPGGSYNIIYFNPTKGFGAGYNYFTATPPASPTGPAPGSC